jgi:hypothetical protein
MSRSANALLGYMVLTSEHIRDCSRCNAILEHACAAWIDEVIEARMRTLGERPGRERLTFVPPSHVWSVIGEIFPELMKCERWPKLTIP